MSISSHVLSWLLGFVLLWILLAAVLSWITQLSIVVVVGGLLALGLGVSLMLGRWFRCRNM